MVNARRERFPVGEVAHQIDDHVANEEKEGGNALYVFNAKGVGGFRFSHGWERIVG
jgi:hypothetical protein